MLTLQQSGPVFISVGPGHQGLTPVISTWAEVGLPLLPIADYATCDEAELLDQGDIVVVRYRLAR